MINHVARSMRLAAALTLAGSLASAQTTRPASRAGEDTAGQPATRPAMGHQARPATRPTRDLVPDVIKDLEKGHNKPAWSSHSVLKSGLEVHFGGQKILEGTLFFDTVVGHSRIELADGTVLVFDGEAAWVSPADASVPRARFHLLTWPYFVAAPFKFSDPGANVEPKGVKVVGEEAYETALVTFDPGTGDAPRDWYYLYIDPVKKRLHALAYIVTYGTPKEEAEEDPHAVVYSNYMLVGGCLIPRQYDFYSWSEEEGIHGEKIGEFMITDPEFVELEAARFEKPENALEDPLPPG